MPEVGFVDIHEVVPQEEMVASWVDKSNSVFNSALREYADIHGQYNSIDDLGYEEVNWESVFTGVGYCIDGVIAYGEALSARFPFVKNLKMLDIKPGDLYSHTLVGFTIDGQNLFLDSTYGQVTKEENKVILGKVDELDKYYNLTPISESESKNWTDDMEDSHLVNNKYILSDFKKNSTLRRSAVSVPIAGAPTTTADHLVNALGGVNIGTR